MMIGVGAMVGVILLLKIPASRPIKGEMSTSLAHSGLLVVRRRAVHVRRQDGYEDRQIIAEAARDAR